MYYLFLRFENAGVFKTPPVNKKLGDGVKGERKRIKENITYSPKLEINHVTNALHVLCGLRPISKTRPYNSKLDISFDSELCKIVEQGYYKINNEIIYEGLTLNKSKWNAAPTNPIFTWNLMKTYLGEENYALFLDFLNKEEINIPNVFMDLISIKSIIHEALQKDSHKLFVEKLRLDRKGLFLNFWQGNGSPNQSSLIRKTALRGREEMFCRISGVIVLPFNNLEFLEKLKLGRGVATILDGGLVYVLGVEGFFLPNIENYKLIKEQ